ncbi:ankyrin repeat-containing domain protein [Aspergillus heterothallicus]
MAPMGAARLSDLPPEILHLIARQIPSDRVLNALARTCKVFFDVFNPYLYTVNGTCRGRNSALLWAAAKEGREETMRVALRYHNPLRKTKPLIVAVKHNQDKIVEILLAQEGVNTEALDSTKSTPLEIAVENDNELIVKQLLDVGANVYPRKTTLGMRYRRGDSLLLKSIRLGRGGVSRQLIRSGKFDLDEINPSTLTALHVAIYKQRERVIEELLVAGADPNRGWPLARAVVNTGVSIVRLLLEHGADPNGVDDSVSTMPVYLAIQTGRLDALRALLESENLDINFVNHAGDTPLEYALAAREPDIVKRLPEIMDIMLRREDLDVNNRLPFCCAVQRGFAGIVRAFLDTNRLTPQSINEGFLAAVDGGNLEIVQLLLGSEEIDVNHKSAFCRAIEHGHIHITQALLGDARLNRASKRERLIAIVSRDEESTNVLIQPILDSGMDRDDKEVAVLALRGATTGRNPP